MKKPASHEKLDKIAADKKRRDLPDLSKIDKTITKNLVRDKEILNKIADPAMRFLVKKNTDEYFQAMKAYRKQLEDTITDGGKQNLTKYGYKLLEDVDKYIEMNAFKELHLAIYQVILGGMGLGMGRLQSEEESIEKNAEKMINEIVAEKIQSLR